MFCSDCGRFSVRAGLVLLFDCQACQLVPCSSDAAMLLSELCSLNTHALCRPSFASLASVPPAVPVCWVRLVVLLCLGCLSASSALTSLNFTSAPSSRPCRSWPQLAVCFGRKVDPDGTQQELSPLCCSAAWIPRLGRSWLPPFRSLPFSPFLPSSPAFSVSGVLGAWLVGRPFVGFGLVVGSARVGVFGFLVCSATMSAFARKLVSYQGN